MGALRKIEKVLIMKKKIISSIFVCYFLLMTVQNVHAYDKRSSIRITHQAFFQILERPVLDKKEFYDYFIKLNQKGWTTKQVIEDLVIKEEHFQRFYLGKKYYIKKIFQHILSVNISDRICKRSLDEVNMLEKKYGLYNAFKIFKRSLLKSTAYSKKFGLHQVPRYNSN